MNRTKSSAVQLLAGAAAFVTLSSTPLLAQDPPKKEPIRLDNWIGGPSWIKFSGQHRTRFESLNGQFRSSALRNTEDQLFNRSILRADIDTDSIDAVLEGMDARAFGTKADSFANTTTVNTFDVLQANVVFPVGDGHLTVGRYTMDIGSRRLSARNKYRNTINSFNGFRYDKTDEDGNKLRVFWNMPTIRRPSARMELVDNEHDWDRQSSDLQFYGVHATRVLSKDSHGEMYLLGLNDNRDGSADRDLLTTGVRFLQQKKPGQFFGEAETAFQFGERNNEDVSAWFAHGSVGYVGEGECRPTFRLAYDHATGDSSSTDGDYNRFDTLFGARRFEYGPTGIYGAIGRRNISSPEIRFDFKPSATTWVMVAYRHLMLASDNDAWVEAGLSDPTGAAGTTVGSQIECRLRWEPCKKQVRIEGGGAYFAGGSFRDATQPVGGGDTRYGFLEVIFWF